MTPLRLALVSSFLLISTVNAGHDGHHGGHRNGTRHGRLVPFGKPAENSTALANTTIPLANSTTELGGNATLPVVVEHGDDEEDCEIVDEGVENYLPYCDEDETVTIQTIETPSITDSSSQSVPTIASDDPASTSGPSKRWDWRSAFNAYRPSSSSGLSPISTALKLIPTTTSKVSTPTVIALPVVTSLASSAAPASTSLARTPSSGGTSAADIAAYLKAHNDFRAQYNAAPLVWNDTLATYGKDWSSGCVWKHSGGKYGENLAAGTSLSISSAIKMWNDEAPDYNKAVPNYSHFTQVVWKGSKQLGCGVASCPGLLGGSQAASFYTCEYYPPGNYLGQFSKNVEGTTCTNC